jgi:hypothetical protein
MWKTKDWELLTKVNELMRPVVLIIRKLEGTAYPTQSLILTLFVCLEKHIEKFKKGTFFNNLSIYFIYFSVPVTIHLLFSYS